MEVIDYNGDARWSREAILERYARFAAEAGVAPRDISPQEHTEWGRRWVYPVMRKVIEGIEADDPACVRLGIEFIEGREVPVRANPQVEYGPRPSPRFAV